MFRELSCLAVMIPLGAVCMGIVFGPAMAMAQPTPMPATSDEARVRQVADQFFAAYPKQDLDGLMALWSQQSPDYARRRQAMQDFFAASRDIQLKSLALISVTVEGNTARAQVEVEIALTDMTSGQPSPRVGQLQRVLYLVREDNMWKVWRYLPADLVQALWEASTKEERLWLLRAEKEQLTEAKLTGINEVAVEEAQQGRFERAEQLNEIACQAAAVLGDTAQQGWCMLYQGMIFHYQARYPLAVDHFTQAQALFRTAEDRLGEAVTLTRLNQTLFACQPDLVVLSYLVGEEETLLFGLTRGADAQSPATLTEYRLPVTRAALTQNVREFLPRFATKGGRYSSYAHQLYQSLLARAEPTFTGKTHVVIIPDGVLHALPFQALLDGQDAHLIERYAISYSPSATALDEMLRVADQRREIDPPPLSLLAMGHPTFPPGIEALPATATEVQEIGTLFGSSAKVLTGPEASEAAAKAALGQARYVHLATHSWLNDVAPLYSAVVLARGTNDDGWLHAQELMDLELQAELVTLSACQTESGQEVSGEGIQPS